jgi:hypothetical protein
MKEVRRLMAEVQRLEAETGETSGV